MAFVTVSPLDTTYGWHGEVYPAGCTSVPESLAIALGLWSPEGEGDGSDGSGPENPEPENENLGTKSEKSISQNKALSLINDAKEADAIEVLPGIGPASASRIFAAKPSEGFSSLEAVALVPDLPSSIDWDAVEAWSPDA